MRRLVPIMVVMVAAATVATGCSSSGSNGSTSSIPTHAAEKPVPAPAGLPAFYSVPQPLPTATGALIKSEKVSASDLHGTLYRVMYVSQTVKGAPVAVTGLIAVPRTAPPADGYPMVTWGHGTNGMADKCAPSLDPSSAVPETNALLDKGWEVTASDYQGEGTPGLMPYIAGVSAARNTIDIVRAARHLPAAHASSRYMVWGHSEGGQTAMFALHIGTTYAPELSQAGVVAGAPPSQLNLVYTFLKGGPYKYYLLMAAGGLNAAYGDKLAPLTEVLTPKGMDLLPDLDEECADGLARIAQNIKIEDITKADPFTIPAWRKLLQENDPQSFTTAAPAPLLIIQGGADEQIPVASTQILAQHLCSVGQDVERWIYPGQSHSGVIAVSTPDMVHWMSDRFAGDPNPDPYVPTGQAGIQVTRCP